RWSASQFPRSSLLSYIILRCRYIDNRHRRGTLLPGTADFRCLFADRRESAEGGRDLDEGIDDRGIEMRALPRDDEADRIVVRHGGAVGATGGHGVVDVDERDEPAGNRNRPSAQALGIAAAVPFLVMCVHDLL